MIFKHVASSGLGGLLAVKTWSFWDFSSVIFSKTKDQKENFYQVFVKFLMISYKKNLNVTYCEILILLYIFHLKPNFGAEYLGSLI